MQGPNLRSMAWHNLWRNRRRTIITLISIAFGGLLAVLTTAMQDRSFADFIDSAARTGGGHVTLGHPEYARKRNLLNTVRDGDTLREMALSDPEVVTVVPRISGQVMLASARASHGAIFMAIDPQLETPDTFTFWEGLVEGEALASADARGIVLGERLAQKLGVTLGKKVVFTVVDKSGEVVANMERLTGIIRTGVPSLDSGLCVLAIDRMRRALAYGEHESTQIAVFVDDARASDEVAERLGARVGPEVVALTWDKAQPQLASFIAMKIGGGRVMQILVTVLVAAGIFNTLFVSVMERLREFGILIAIGFSTSQLFRLVMWESLWLGIVGLGVGAIVTAGPYFYLASTGLDTSAMTGGSATEVAGVGFDPILRVGIFPESALFIAVTIVAATLCAGIYPAIRAGRVNPVDTIRLV